MIAAMSFHGSALKIYNTPAGIINLEFAGTIGNASSVYNSWGETLIDTAIANIFLDFIFIICYVCFLFTACFNLAWKAEGIVRKIGKWLSTGMILAAILDVFENILMLRTLTGHFSKEVVAATFIFASVKFILVGLGVLFIIFCLIFGLHKKQENKFQYLEGSTAS
jgi:hypothetical protein